MYKRNMKKFTKVLLLCLHVLFSLASCKEKPDDKQADLSADSLAMKNTDTLNISEETMTKMIQSIPSPVEMSALIKATGNDFNKEILNSTENTANYATSHKKAFAVGIYGADLGYINVYEKTYSALNYLNAIKGLADDIKVGQFFDFNNLKRFAKSNSNVDSLLYLSTSSFNNMDEYLRQQRRGNLSVLMVSGAWLEGLYIATMVVKDKPNEELYQRIGEQKSAIDNLLLLLSVYQKDAYTAEVTLGIESLRNEYENVAISYEYREPETKEMNGELVVVDNSKTIVNITPAQIKAITAAVEKVRNKAIL